MASPSSSSMPASMATGLEQGVVALLGSKSSRALLDVVSHEDLILICCALIAVMSMIPRNLPMIGRISSIMKQIFATIALNTTLSAVIVDSDPALTSLNLLGVFFFGSSLQQDTIGATAQYLLISNLSMALQGFKGGALAVAWALALVPTVLSMDRELIELAQLVTVDTFTNWFRTLLPRGTLLPSTILLLYLIVPISKQIPLLTRLYRFAVFAVANDPQIHAIPSWITATVLWLMWLKDPDPTGKIFASMAGANVAVLVILDAVRVPMDNDPAPVLIAILVAFRIMEK